MNVDKQSFGNNTEGQETDCIKNKFVEADTYHNDKETEEIDIDKEIEEFLACVDEYIEDVPSLSQEEIRERTDKILAEVYPEEAVETPVVPISEGKKKNRSAKRVLLIAAAIAMLTVLSIGGILVFGDNNELETENSAATYDGGSVRITFFGEDGEEYITVDTLLKDLEAHGYKDIMFPEAFLFDDTCKVSLPEYTKESVLEQVSFYVYQGENEFFFCIDKAGENKQANLPDLENAKTVDVNDKKIYIFEYDNNHSTIYFFDEAHEYYLNSTSLYSIMVEIAETIK